MTIETVCITGGAGFIGSHLADAFVKEGRRVLVVDDLSSGRRENLPAEAEFHQLDVRSREAAELVEGAGIDLLVHQAAQMDVRRSVADPVFDAGVNVVGSLNLFEAARRGGVAQVLFASTGGAIYGEQEVFPAGEDPIDGVHRDALVDGLRARGHRLVMPLPDPAELASIVNDLARPGDMVVCLGAGTISAWANQLPEQLRG